MSYSIFRAPVLSFYSRSFYSDTARQGRGTGFLYLFVVLLLCYPISLVSGYFHFLSSLDRSEVTAITSKLPDMTVRQGVLTINKPSPYKMEFKNATTGEKTLIIFDTTGHGTLTDDAKALVTEKGILFDNQNPLIPWSQIASDFDFPASKFKESMKRVVLGIASSAFLLIPLVWCGHVLLALIYALVGLIMDRNKLGFLTALRMASVSMTPAIVLTTLFYVFFGNPEMFVFLLLWELITVPITLGYLFFGYNALTSDSQ